MASADFWDDQNNARVVSQKFNNIKEEIALWENLRDRIKDISEYLKFIDEHDETFRKELQKEVDNIESELEKLELSSLLDEEYDENKAILYIQAGAGGTESQDWAEMLLRMYLRWAEKNSLDTKIVDRSVGDVAGIKSVTFMISGKYAYGYLKSEKGVHRLVRLSPFDAANRRHTSFASVDVIPEIDDHIEVNIKPDDILVETFRSSGAGGQHVNKTDSAVRIRHLPTGIIVQCQNERSQHSNRMTALRILYSKLFELEKNKQREKLDNLRGEHMEIAWGSQIRSYVFHPYNLVKDHRSLYQMSNSLAVMDGELNSFIYHYLKYNKKLKNDQSRKVAVIK
ncbi:MAG: Peptide chain release factor 2 [bacterium ADurb.Bin363]|nr:MAG: Peptide chain release factor 2 [bacterium ADurb.Bin363]